MMHSTPQSTRSSASPNQNRTGHHEYLSSVPKSVQLGSRQLIANRSVKAYTRHMREAIDDYQETMLPLPSTTSTSNWSTTALLPERCTQPSPNILSAEYDSFASFYPDLTTSFEAAQNERLNPTRSTDTSLPPTSPSLSAVNSHRSSFSSAPASETHSNPEVYQTFHPRIKMEDPLEWPSETNGSLLLSNSHIDGSNMSSSVSPYPGCVEATFFHLPTSSISWSKTAGTRGASEYSMATGNAELSEPGRQQSDEARKLLGNIMARTRTPRKMTSREDANFQCKAKGCGKLFSRSYNFKAHMETHDTGRVYPFPCPLSGCNKKFVRKTDLQRHHQSVHMKERNYQCDFCSRYFARKDTLRRHMEDGCSKRFDLAVAFNPQHPTNGRVSERKTSDTQPHQQTVLSQYSPSVMPYPQSAPRNSNILADFLSKEDFLGCDDGQQSVWSS